MDVFLIKAAQLLCCLSLLVVLHEGGHFFFSKLFKVRVEKFYLFFNPKFHLFSTKDKWFAKRFPRIAANETEYGIGWIPLGGYVKIAGMMDESMDTEQMKQPAKPDEFRSQAVWKRFFIMVGGVLMNLLTSFVIYCAVMLVWGMEVVPMQHVKTGFVFNEAGHQMGFVDRDIPVAINGEPLQYWNSSILRTLSEAREVTVLRGGRKVTFQVPEDHPDMLEMAEMTPPIMTAFVPADIDSVVPDGPAFKAGLVPHSRITAVNGTRVRCWADFDSITTRIQDKLAVPCSPADSLALRTMVISHYRHSDKGAQLSYTDTLHLGPDYRLGILKSQLTQYVKVDTIGNSLVQCVPAGLSYGWNQLTGYVHDLKYVFTKKGAQSVGSFITIGSIFPATWDWRAFWHLTALISIILAVMNILPIPGLDGGHVMFLLLEAIMGRPLGEKAQTVFEYIGMGLLLALMVFAFGNDIFRFVLN